MTETSLTRSPSDDFTEEQINDILQQGDISNLDVTKRSRFLYRLAEKLKLDPFARPFDLIHVKKPDGSKKLIIYANKSASDQIRERDNLSVECLEEGPLVIGDHVDDSIYIFRVKISNPEGRTEFNVGAVSLAGLDGEDKANAIMKGWTKASRRATLGFAGLGFPDESEVGSIPGTVTVTPGEGKPVINTPPAVEAQVTSSLPRASSSSKPPVRVTP
ncbi:MAG: hypothetical protein GY906_24715 [bacterium]|nr:hypothetical protein [bacterium]